MAGSVTAGGASGAGGAAPLNVLASSPPSLCPGQGFVVQLTAVGGVAPYTWALANGTPASTSLSTTTGSEVQVSGVASKPQPSLQVGAHDATGASATTSIALTVQAVGPGECPKITPAQLPDPCQDNAYSAKDVTVTGGTSPFVWSALSIPEGLSFDTAQQIVSGTALAAGKFTPLTLQVTDSKGLMTQMTYPLTYRDKCWLGFTSTAPDSPKVHLFDPALSSFAPALEASSNNVGVVDFKFSPDGKFLVYRRAATSGGTQDLVLAAAPDWVEQVFDFGGSVLEYSWSNSATVLAVAFQTDAGTMLGGLNLANVMTASASGGGITGVQSVSPVAMLDPASAPLDSDLLWIQSDTYLAFHADALPGGGTGFEVPYYTHFDGTAFLPVPPSDGIYFYFGAIQLLPAYNGLFAVFPGQPPQLDFWGTAGGLDFDGYLATTYTTAVADPAGRYVAMPLQDKLQIFLTAESGGSGDPPTPWTPSTDNCSSILAWDPSHERIACDAGVSADGGAAQGEVRIFDLAGTTATPQITMTPVKVLSGYQQGDAIGHRRSFSAAGSWLAFTTDTAVYVADVREEPQIQQQQPAPLGTLPTTPTELAFSPDENLLLWQVADNLGVIPLQTNGVTSWEGSDLLVDPAPCNEDFAGGPDHWCGKLKGAGAPVWSADSRFAAVAMTGQGVRVYDLEHYISLGAVGYADACQTGCSGAFAFQP